jgi:hypothetical protein
MSRLILATDKVNEDEPCISLKELVENSPMGKKHRYQIIRVLRGDKIVEFRHDLGRANRFKAGQFIIPGCGEDNVPVERVGDLVEIADYMREQKPRHPEMPMQDLLSGYYEVRNAQLKGHELHQALK